MATTHELRLACFPPEVLIAMIPPKLLLHVYSCGDSVLNQKIRQGDDTTLIIEDYWFDPKRRAQWPLQFLTSAPIHLTAFEFTSQQSRDYTAIIN